MITPSLNAYSANTRKNIKNNTTVKGYILNTHIQPQQQNDFFNKAQVDFLISEKNETSNETQKETLKEDKNKGFNDKNALKPILALTGATLGVIGAISLCAKSYSKSLAKAQGVVRPPDLARNINIVEEPHFAMYRALRDPNAKNILGLTGVALMSGITLSAKNFVDGAKEIWVTKQNNDIQYDFEKDSIDIEKRSFGGKLKVVDELLAQTSNYFKTELEQKDSLNFRGNEDRKEESNIKEKSVFKSPILKAALGIGAFVSISFLVFKNYQKTVKNLDTFVEKTTDSKIKNDIANAINSKDKNKAIENLSNILKTTNASDERIRANLGSIKGISEDEINKAAKAIKEAQIYVQAPEALGGVSEKIQYYCYINEDRGHLYNWILNPENKFNKYIFLSFSAISSIGYLAKSSADAVKQVLVLKENNKNKLDLKNKLADVEIENFKAKKQAALEPMIENFKIQKQQGKSKEELEQIAQNILLEIKNGPPYVYD